jgi:uncharacterized protein (TIGR04222 family)
MWPFDLRGPDFLILYLVVCTIVTVAVFLLRHSAEAFDAPRINLSDPYLIAFLRGGKNETLRVATMSLVDRGLLAAPKKSLEATEGALGKTASPLEQKILRYFMPSGDASSLFKLSDVDPEMRHYENELTRLGLLPDLDQKEAQLLRMAVALLAVLGLAIVKIIVALNTGHRNIGFLIVLAIIFTIVVVKLSRPRLTRAGERMIADLRTLFGSLKDRSEHLQNGASPTEFALMAAVFGMSAVPQAKTLFPRAAAASGSSCGSTCGSSSGGDGGGDGGSSCGGGGCGGCGGG